MKKQYFKAASIKLFFFSRYQGHPADLAWFGSDAWKTAEKKNFNMPQREKKYDGGKRKLQRAAVVRQNHEDVQIIQGQPARRVQTDGKISRQGKIRGRDMNASTPKRKMMQ